MTTPLAKDFDVYDLTADRVVDGPWPPRAETPLAVVAEPDALAPAKKKGGRPKGSKSKPKKLNTKKRQAAEHLARISEAEAALPPQAPVQSLRIAAGGEGMLSRVRRITADQWLWLLIPVAAAALGLSLAFLTGAVKL